MGLDFAAVDFETANYSRGSICQVGLTTVTNGVVTSSYQTLVQPPPTLPGFTNSWVHGISEADVRNAPTARDVLLWLTDALAMYPLVVAHNASFDKSAFRSACREVQIEPADYQWVCTMDLAKQLLDLYDYKLTTVVEALGVELQHHHDAGDDAHAAALVALKLAGLANTNDLRYGLSRIHHAAHKHSGASEYMAFKRPRAIPEPNRDASEASPFYGHLVLFTGDLSMTREDAWGLVARFGGQVKHSYSRKVTVVVVGHHPGAKLGQMHEVAASGRPVCFLDEAAFLDVVSAAEAGLPTPLLSAQVPEEAAPREADAEQAPRVTGSARDAAVVAAILSLDAHDRRSVNAAAESLDAVHPELAKGIDTAALLYRLVYKGVLPAHAVGIDQHV